MLDTRGYCKSRVSIKSSEKKYIYILLEKDFLIPGLLIPDIYKILSPLNGQPHNPATSCSSCEVMPGLSCLLSSICSVVSGSLGSCWEPLPELLLLFIQKGSWYFSGNSWLHEVSTIQLMRPRSSTFACYI